VRYVPEGCTVSYSLRREKRQAFESLLGWFLSREMSTPVLFEDIFECLKRDPDGKKFDKGTYAGTCPSMLAHLSRSWHQPHPCNCSRAVSRYVCKSDLFECDMTLDVNIDVYPLEVIR